MKDHVLRVVFVLLLLSVYGCSSSRVVRQDEVENSDVVASMNDSAVTDAEVDTSGIQKYEQEESVLAQILAYYEQILVAHREGDFGLAETLIDSAFVMYGQVNVDEITDQSLVARFTSISSSLAREYGVILMDSDQISQEDPESWIPDLSDAEQFKSGQWSDEELKSIVNKISRKCDIPIDYNEKVRNSISYFQNSGRKHMTLWLQRSGRYIPMMQKEFEEAGVPLDLAYLSMIESGLNPRAVSSARCVGLWQFFYTTGKMYGLERNEWYDERRDPVKSTKAAAQHLKDLFKLYDDWNLVLAAYNSGSGRVSRAIKSGGLNDYWRMNLPKETQNYVPTFMATLIICKAPELFGFENIQPEPLLDYETVEVRPRTSLKVAAQCASMDMEEMRLLNCELIRDCAPGGRENYQLRVPKGCGSQFLAEYAKLPVEKTTSQEAVASSSGTIYRVRSGDTLSKIASRYRVSLSSLMSANRLKRSSHIRIGQKLVIPGTARTASASASSSSSSRSAAKPAGISGGTTRYTVQKEDTLWELASRHNTTVDALVAINNLRDSSNLKVGQTILIPGSGSGSGSSSGSAEQASAGSETVTYVVRKNDSLYEIATKYRVSYKDIMVWNKIKDHRRIKPGDRLVIKTRG